VALDSEMLASDLRQALFVIIFVILTGDN